MKSLGSADSFHVGCNIILYKNELVKLYCESNFMKLVLIKVEFGVSEAHIPVYLCINK